jgi:PAS domain S-box-containing protein/putative nucleotidyltransferase with HDIG domain
MREIGQATSTILDIDELLEYTMKTIEKRLDFDRGMIMLANKNKTHLVYQAGFGYQIDDAAESTEIKFHLDKPESKGVVVETFRRQQPYLVDDIRKVEESFSERSRGIARQMDVNAFICVPIVFEKESLGVLMVDNIKTKRPLKESDMSLLMGIAPQVAISIANATSFQRIRASEERFRALSENAPDIVYTLDVRGSISYVNPSWERILGYRTEEAIGRPLLNFLRKADAKMLVRAFQKIVDGRQRIVNLYGIILHRDGSERLFNMSGVPNMDAEGHVIGVVGTFKDVTDLTKSELELQVSYQKLKSVMSSTIDTISIIVESRDPYTAGHQRRVADLAVSIAAELGFPEEKKDLIRMGSLIHDIGKIYIPAEILTRPVQLNNIEFSMMQAHTTVGYNILKKVDFIPSVVNMVYQHHERMDGSGYPKGIPGDQILMESRIIAVADTVEAMASHRPYRPSLGITAALDEIRLYRGSRYDAEVVDACLRLFEEKGFEFRQDDAVIHADR